MNIDWLRAFCLSLPGAKEEIKWENDLCFTVGKKLFCVTGLVGAFQFSFKIKDEEFEELSTGVGFVPAPYMARARWVLVTQPLKLSKKDAENYIRNSYTMIFNKLAGKEKNSISRGKISAASGKTRKKK